MTTGPHRDMLVPMTDRVSAMPFSTSLLAEYISFRLAVVVYWLNLVALGATLLFSLRYSRRHDLQGA